jgi:hypothetical protein
MERTKYLLVCDQRTNRNSPTLYHVYDASACARAAGLDDVLKVHGHESAVLDIGDPPWRAQEQQKGPGRKGKGRRRRR